MVWTSLSPDGTKSVRTNVPVMLDNTEYTETTMNKDHYWNIGADEDGHHKQVKMPKSAADITLGTGIDGGIYLKEAASGTVQGYYRNVVNVYQFIPAFLSGTVLLIPITTTIVTAVPNNTYGNIMFFLPGTTDSSQMGWFVASGGVVRAYSCGTIKTGASTTTYNVILANDSSGLNIRAKVSEATSDVYQYRITYWDI